MAINALIPLQTQAPDSANALLKGAQFGNALLQAPLEREEMRAKTRYYSAMAEDPSKSSAVYGTPIYGVDPVSGETVLGAIGKGGTFERLDTQGVQVTPGVSFQNLGDRVQPFSSKSGAPVGPATPMSGDVPSSYRPSESGGYEPMPGTKEAEDRALSADKRQNKAAFASRQAGIVSEDITRAKNIIDSSDLPTTGYAGNILSNIGGTGAHDLQQVLQGIKANIGFDRLQVMRDNSPTGGALGQVAVQELEALQATYGSVLQSQSTEQLKYNLDRLNNVYLDVVHGPGNRPGGAQRGPAAETPSASNPAQYKLPPGVTFDQLRSWVQEAQSAGVPIERIRQKMIEMGIDPDQ